jgi:hypothetical protein
MLIASVRVSSIPYAELDAEEIEELEVTERGVSVMSFRDLSSEIILKTYCLMFDNFKQEGE